MEIMALNSGVPLRVRTGYFAFWLQILAVACGDWRKCLPSFFWLVLHRCAGANGTRFQRLVWQVLSFLIAAIAMKAALALFISALVVGCVLESIRRLFSDRAAAIPAS